MRHTCCTRVKGTLLAQQLLPMELIWLHKCVQKVQPSLAAQARSSHSADREHADRQLLLGQAASRLGMHMPTAMCLLLKPYITHNMHCCQNSWCSTQGHNHPPDTSAQSRDSATAPGLSDLFSLAAVSLELGLVASVGVAGNKTVAKLASAAAKPDGICCISTAEDLRKLMTATPASRLPQCGGKDSELFQAAGIATMADLQVCQEMPMYATIWTGQCKQVEDAAHDHGWHEEGLKRYRTLALQGPILQPRRGRSEQLWCAGAA